MENANPTSRRVPITKPTLGVFQLAKRPFEGSKRFFSFFQRLGGAGRKLLRVYEKAFT